MKIKLSVNKTELILDSKSAVFISASQTLVIADVHLGKSATFRARGVPIPEGSTLEDLRRIHNLIKKYDAKRLVIAGDFVHSSDGMSVFVVDAIKEWIRKSKADIILTKGNHDSILVTRFLENHGVEICKFYETNGILITHYPKNLKKEYAGIAGHVHPGIRLIENGKTSLKLKGFYLTRESHLVLPAFSEFTGNYYVSREKSDRFIAIASDRLYEIPHK